MLDSKIHSEIGSTFGMTYLRSYLKEKNLNYDSLWKVYVLLIMRPNADDGYIEYLRTREYKCIETIF